MAVHRSRWQVWWNLWKACAGDKEEGAAAVVTVEVELGTVVVVEADTGGTDLDLESKR